MKSKLLYNLLLMCLCLGFVFSSDIVSGAENKNIASHDNATGGQSSANSKNIEDEARAQYVRMQEAWLGDILKKGGWRPDMIPGLSQASQQARLNGGLPVQDLQSLLTNEHVGISPDNLNANTKWNDVNMFDEVTRLLAHIQNSATNSVNYYTHRLTVENIQGDIFISLYNVHQEFCHRLMNYRNYDPVIAYGVGFPQRQPVSDFCQDGDNVVVWEVPEYHNLLKKDFMRQFAKK